MGSEKHAYFKEIKCRDSPLDAIEGLRIRPLILADSPYPLKDQLTQPFKKTRFSRCFQHLH